MKLKKTIMAAGLILLLALLTFFVSRVEVRAQTTSLAIPPESDWVDHGLIFSHGAEGEWDNILWGGFAGCVTKKDGLFYLYYQGSDGYDDVAGTVTHRAIGVATSSDGLSFQKHPSNPIITYSPTGNIEEGAVSCGVSQEGQDIVMYYGANRSTSPTSPYVNANGIAAASADGVTFSDLGVALRYSDSSLWGYGDEVFPVMSLKAAETNQWLVYYIPNGVSQSRLLGAAWGNSMLDLANSTGVRDDNGNNISTWGMGGGVVSLQNGTYAVFTNDVSTGVMKAWVMDPSNPGQFSGPVQTYNFAGFSSGVVYYDDASGTWYLFYRNQDASAYGVKTAVASQPVNQPPTVSAGQDTTAQLQNGVASVGLSGSASDDGLPDPPGTITTTWRTVSGPGSVTFSDPNNLNTTATFTAEGSYVLELLVSDSELMATDTVTITVEAAPPTSPCRLDSVDWNRNSAGDGQKVHLRALTSNCLGGEVVHFDIYETMAGSQAPLQIFAETTTVASNNQARIEWSVTYNCHEPGIDCPAPEDVAVYYAVAYLADSPNQTITSPQIVVSPK